MKLENIVSTTFLIALLTVVLFVGVWQIKPAVASDTLIDSYTDSTVTTFNLIPVGGLAQAGQSFTMLSSDYKITSAKFRLSKTGLPNGTGYAFLYAHSGTYGASSVPTGSALAQSEGLDISTIAGSSTVYELTFNASQQYTMIANAYYCSVFGNATTWEGDSSNYIQFYFAYSSPTHSGNEVKYTTSSGTWNYDVGFDAVFYVYGILATATPPIFTVQSPNTTTVSTVCLFSSLITDNVEVDFAIFGTNNTGHWVNETAVDISAVSGWLNVTKTLNDTVGNVVQSCWWANDTSNNWANSSIQSLTTTSGTYYLTINSLPVSVTYTINGTISGASVTASSGSPADIQTAVNTIYAAGGGTTYVPAGDFTFNPPAVNNGYGVSVPIGVNIVGAGINVTILRESSDVSFINSVKTYMFYLAWSPYTTKTNRISGISFIGHVDSDSSDKVAIFIEGRKDFRVDHCSFDDFPSQGIFVKGSRGVMDHCDFDNHYRLWMAPYNDSAFPEPYARWGYGVIVIGSGGAESWVTDTSTFLGVYDTWGTGHPPVYIENCNFTRCRHALSSNTNGYYVVRYCHFQKGFYGQVDTHGGNPGGRGIESYNNTFDLSDQSYSDGQGAAFQLRGGGGVVFNNTAIFNASYTNKFVWLLLETTPPWDIHDLYVWNNTATNTIVNDDPSGTILNVDYFLRAPTLALDGFIYTPYTYPHPLATTANSGVTNDTIGLTEGTYTVTILSQVVVSGYTYNFVEWQDSSTDTTIIVSLTANATVTATYTDVSIVSVSITTPTNTTYTSSSIFVNFTASGGTIEDYWFNVKNGTAWVYTSNQTYPGYEMAIGLANGDHYALYAFANNTDGTEGYATVMFTVDYTYSSVTVTWGGYWGRWWGYP
jgi:hypothetical protein